MLQIGSLKLTCIFVFIEQVLCRQTCVQNLREKNVEMLNEKIPKKDFAISAKITKRDELI